MADIDLQGRKPEDVPPVADNPNPEKTVNVEKKTLPEGEQKLKSSSPIVELRPTMHVQGNEMIVLIQVLSSINRNLAFLSKTIFEHLNPEKKEKGNG